MSVEEVKSEEALVSIDPLDNPEVNKAAYEFSQLAPKVRALAKNMKAGELARVYIAAAEFPFAENYPKFLTNAGQELFMLTLHLQGLKSVMSQAVSKHQKEIEDLAVSGIVEELKEQKMEEVNGKV